MLTLKMLKEAIDSLPGYYRCYAYEGEITGIVIVDEHRKQVGYIEAGGTDENNDGELKQ